MPEYLLAATWMEAVKDWKTNARITPQLTATLPYLGGLQPFADQPAAVLTPRCCIFDPAAHTGRYARLLRATIENWVRKSHDQLIDEHCHMAMERNQYVDYVLSRVWFGFAIIEPRAAAVEPVFRS